jgi:hypothetical protein
MLKIAPQKSKKPSPQPGTACNGPSSQNQLVNEMFGLFATLLPVATIEASVWL